MSGPGFHFIGDDEERELLKVIRSRNLTRYRFEQTGDQEPTRTYLFEREMEQRLGTAHCLAVNSGTSALLVALLALGVESGEEVLVPGYTFIASISAIVYARAVPILVEIDESLTVDLDDLERKISPRTRAILAVHMLGAPCRMDRLREIATRHGLLLIEDVAQACGATFHGAFLGTWGDVGAFSLNVFKTITAGDGGFLTIRDEEIYRRAYAVHDHGFAPFRLGVKEVETVFGLNLRMAEFTGALALVQGRKLAQILDCTRAQKARLVRAIGDVPGARRRVLHDEAGEAATVLVWIFETASLARQVASAVGARTLRETGRHYYGNMSPLLNRALPYRRSCPFSCPGREVDATYRKGMLPRTDDILGRAVALSVGVSDSYLGTGFGIGVFSTEEEVQAAGEAFLTAVKAAHQSI